MLRLVLGLAAAVGIGATALSWMYNNKTEEELKREEELKKELKEPKLWTMYQLINKKSLVS